MKVRPPPFLMLTFLVFVTSLERVTSDEERRPQGQLKDHELQMKKQSMGDHADGTMQSEEMKITLKYEQEMLQLKQRLAASEEKETMIEAKLAHLKETNLLLREKQDSIDEASRYKRENSDLKSTLATMRSEISELKATTRQIDVLKQNMNIFNFTALNFGEEKNTRMKIEDNVQQILEKVDDQKKEIELLRTKVINAENNSKQQFLQLEETLTLSNTTYQKREQEILISLTMMKEHITTINETVRENEKKVSRLQEEISNCLQEGSKLNTSIIQIHMLYQNELKQKTERLMEELNTLKILNNENKVRVKQINETISGKMNIFSNTTREIVKRIHETEAKVQQQLETLQSNITANKSLAEELHLTQTGSKRIQELTAQIQDLKRNLDDAALQITKENLPMVQLGGKSYHFSKNMANWHDAQRFCRSRGLELAALETEEENRLVNDYKYNVIKIRYAWIGGSDDGHEGEWRWSGSERPIMYSNWLPGYGRRGSNYNCMAVYDNNIKKGTWYDNSCGTSYNYVCETTI